MQAKMARKSEAGLLWLRNFIFGCDVMSVQYWESTEKLISYDRENEHFPAWAAFNCKPKDNSAVSIWRATYGVTPEQAENIYDVSDVNFNVTY